ncbi:MAG: glycoside hydrolase family 3 C-terminal domain-containing protein [Anaerolineae bacterium]
MRDIPNLRAQMTLAEKAALCSGLDFWHLKGIERLGIPSIMVTDGPHGLRKQSVAANQVALNQSVPATCFPTASALAATWNRDLLYQVGQALGEECRQEKVGVILGPGANIKRSPLCGRNFEYLSEDPYLTGELAASHIRGVQSQGIGTSLKHYAVNNQEARRMMVDAVVDERALREIYLTGFELAVKQAQPWTVMCAYNKVNGVYCSENEYLMTDILKKEWGHTGLVVTDWGAMDDRVAGLQAGVELEMPGARNGNDARIVAAVQSGQLDEAVLDRAVERILTLICKAEETLSQDFTYDSQAHHALARRVAGEGAVLLKNQGPLLPLPRTVRVALLGRFARTPRYQGAGSSIVTPTRLDNLHDEMSKLLGDGQLTDAPGYTEKGEQVDPDLMQQALETARHAEVVVICAGLPDLYETEGLDRPHMQMPPAHHALIQQIAAVHPRVVVVLSNGAPVEMPWANDVPCILEGYLGGQAGAGAIADILLGVINPSGKLAETFPVKLQDTPACHYFPGGPAVAEYRESIYVGYRYYDTVGQKVLFPFGHGLSFTQFEYRDLRLTPVDGPGGPALTVQFTVRNGGNVAGKEVAQLYVRDVQATVFRPAQELKGFAKVELAPGQETEVTLALARRAFAYYDTDLKEWQVEAGEFEIRVGASSQDIRLTATVSLESAPRVTRAPERDKLATYYHFPKGAPVSPEAFDAILGRPVPHPPGPQKGAYTINTPLGDMQDSFIGRQLFGIMRKQMLKMIAGQEDTPFGLLILAMLQEMPLRSLLMMGDGAPSREALDALLVMMNGRLFRGLFALIQASWAKSRA